MTSTTIDGAAMGRSAADDSRWRDLTDEANRAFEHRDLGLARGLYEEALHEAERLFEASLRNPTAIPIAVIYNISCHNLADLEDSAGDRATAERWMKRAADRLMNAAQSASTPIATRTMCLEDLRHALSLLVPYLRSRGCPEQEVTRYWRRARAIAADVESVVRHANVPMANRPASRAS